jgi:hypothetical protein
MTAANPVFSHSRPKTRSGPILVIATGSVCPAACASSTLTLRAKRNPPRNKLLI